MRVAAIIVALLGAPAARGEVRATLPLEGYYRPGMLMPLSVEGPSSVVEVSGDGVVPTRGAAEGGVAAVLVVGAPDALAVNSAKVAGEFRGLSNDVRLIGRATAKPRAVEAGTVVVALDPLDPVPGPAVAWEALDELIVDRAGASRIGDAKLMELLAAGVAIVVHGESRPAGSLPWRREGDAWVLRVELCGPRGCLFSPAMLPVDGWEPGRSAPFRRAVVLAAALFAILATGVALWRPRLLVAAMAGLVVVTLAAAHAWKARQPAVSTVGGSIVVRGDTFTQTDAWSYHFAPDGATITLPAGARPVAESPGALLQLRPTLIAPDVFECRLPRGGRVATVSRSLTPSDSASPVDTPVDTPVDPAVTSPLAPLARAGYSRPGVTIVGQVPADPWPTVVLQSAER